MTEAELIINGTKIEEKIYLVECLAIPLLGKPAISKLGLIPFIQEIEGSCSLVSKFCKVYQGLEEMRN